MAIWYPSSENDWYVQVGVEWNESTSNTSVSLAPKIYRWDKYDTNNSGSSWWETLNPDPSGAGSWGPYSWGSGSGTRRIDSFGTRTYNRKTSPYNVTLTIETDSSFGTAYDGSFHYIGSWSHSWTYTIPALPSYTITYNANGGTGAPAAQTKWYGISLTLSGTKPTRKNYKFLEF